MESGTRGTSNRLDLGAGQPRGPRACQAPGRRVPARSRPEIGPAVLRPLGKSGARLHLPRGGLGEARSRPRPPQPGREDLAARGFEQQRHDFIRRLHRARDAGTA
ncbi:MAG: hypothetical protein MZV64_11385 [Ignavibacteriales bacterium]|nr:hypothetical protein [Ignavibacteriales bacterium]